MDKNILTYFASPYKHKDYNIRVERFKQVRAVVVRMINEQNYIIPYSPIVYTHEISKDVKNDHDWYEWDMHFLKVCKAMIVVQIDGWEKSEGVEKEIAYCKENDMPILHITLDEVDKLIQHCQTQGFMATLNPDETIKTKYTEGAIRTITLTNIKP